MSNPKETPGAPKGQELAGGHHHSRDASSFDPSSSPAACGQVETGDRLEQIASFLKQAAPRPNDDIAMFGAIGILAGILGRCYNTYTGAGLNQYILLLAKSGLGKDAIDSGQAKLLNSVSHLALNMKDGSINNASTFRGPEIVSAPGAIKWLSAHPSFASIMGEFGYFLKRLESARPSPNDLAIQQFLLRVYSKSGRGNFYDPLAYSEREKQTKPIPSPALTIIAESVPEPVYESLSERLATSGFVPRFMVQEVSGNRPALNENPASHPDDEVLEWFPDLCAYSLQLNFNNQVVRVPADAEASALLRQFDQWCDAEINAHNAEGVRELWNRAHLKALKLATLRAVVNNHLNPLVTLKEAQWATDLIARQTWALIGKFEAGEVGNEAGNETVQERELFNVIHDYVSKSWDECSKYHGWPEMHEMAVITHAHIQQRLYRRKAFYDDPRKAKRAIEETVKSLLEADTLREVPKAQMISQFGRGSKAYVVSNPEELFKRASRRLT